MLRMVKKIFDYYSAKVITKMEMWALGLQALVVFH